MNASFKKSSVPEKSVFKMDGYCIWDPSLVVDGAGEFHMFFSRWPIEKGFEAWVTNSEVCYASAETAQGPFKFEKTIFKQRKGYWDGDVTHNPQAFYLNNKFYIFYNGNSGNGEWWDHRNNQRIGVAVSENPTGPWKRFDAPLLDVTPESWDSMVTTNPTFCAISPDKYMLLYKCVGDKYPAPQYGPVTHGVAFARSPLGPFVKSPNPVFQKGDEKFPGEDPFIWRQDNTFYALLKDMKSFYTTESKAIALFESQDGISWKLSEPALAFTRIVNFESKSEFPIFRMERPFLFLENGRPSTLYCAAKPTKESQESFIFAQKVEFLKR